jgi:hypothetical protein
MFRRHAVAIVLIELRIFLRIHAFDVLSLSDEYGGNFSAAESSRSAVGRLDNWLDNSLSAACRSKEFRQIS